MRSFFFTAGMQRGIYWGDDNPLAHRLSVLHFWEPTLGFCEQAVHSYESVFSNKLFIRVLCVFYFRVSIQRVCFVFPRSSPPLVVSRACPTMCKRYYSTTVTTA